MLINGRNGEPTPITAQQWQLYRRLEDGGYPVSHPGYPFAISQEVGACGTDIFPLDTGTGLALCLRLATPIQFRIHGFALYAEWLATPPMWHVPCVTHPQYHCLHGCRGQDVLFGDSSVLNLGACPNRLINAGIARTGYLVASVPQQVPTSAGRQLEITLERRDGCGTAYAYSVILNNSQECTTSTRWDCILRAAG